MVHGHQFPESCIIFFSKRKADAHKSYLVMPAIFAVHYIAIIRKIKGLKFAAHRIQTSQ